MSTTINFWPLIGVGCVALGFICRFNPMLIVSVAAVVTGMAAKMPFHEILAQMGNEFVRARNLPLVTLLALPVIGLLERHGLREFVERAIAKVRTATPGRLLIIYLFVRELSAAVGLVSIGGHAQMVRPLIAPMAEGVAQSRYGKLGSRQVYRLRAFAASTDNIGLFFGEDIFVAYGGVLFMQNFLHSTGIDIDPMRIALAGIPTALCVFFIHSFRLYRLDGWIEREQRTAAAADVSASVVEECRP